MRRLDAFLGRSFASLVIASAGLGFFVTAIPSAHFDVLAQQVGPQNNASSLFNPLERFEEFSPSMTHDADGNLTGVGSDVFGYDSQSRLVGSTVGGVVSSQVFDGDGLRVARDGDRVGWDRVHGRPVSVGSTALGFGPGGVVSERSSTGVWFGLSDVLGSVRSVTDSSCRVVGSTSFGVWGETRTSTGVGSLVGFQGGVSDTASSVGFGARSYLSQYGSWAQSDPLQPNAPGTQGWLLYGFVGNNPTTFTDRSGFSEFVEYAHVQVLRASAWFGLSGSFGACVTRGLVEAGAVGVGAGVGVGAVDVAATGLSCGLAAGNGKRNVPDVPDDPTDQIDNALHGAGASVLRRNSAGRAIGDDGRFIIDTERVAISSESSGAHGNSRLSEAATSLYRLYDLEGNYLKTGITNNPSGRYSQDFLSDKFMDVINVGSRDNMMNLERLIVEYDPGPLNFERWAGVRR